MTLTLYGGPRTRASMPRWYLEEKGIIGGFDLSWWYPDQSNRLLLTFTDQTSGDDIERLSLSLESWVKEVAA